MAIRASVVAAAALKPLGLGRDLLMVLFFGISVQMDAYYAALLALGLAQGIVTGPLANHWLPRYVSLPVAQRRLYFLLTMRRSILIGVGVSVVLVLSAGWLSAHTNLGQVGSGFFAMLALLGPTIPFVFATSWIGNRFLGDGRPMLAQLVLSGTNGAFLIVLAGVAAFGLPSSVEWLPLYHWSAVLLLTGVTCWPIWFSKRETDSVASTGSEPLVGGGLHFKAFGMSLIETLCFACLQTALIVLPGNIVAGSGTLGGLVARFYSSLLSLFVSPASQGLLYQTATERTKVSLGSASGLVFTILGLATFGWLLSLLIGAGEDTTKAALLGDFVGAYALQFTVLGLIVVAVRLLSAVGKPYLGSLSLSVAYALAFVGLLGIHPASNPVAYVFIASALLAPVAIGLFAFSVVAIRAKAHAA